MQRLLSLIGGGVLVLLAIGTGLSQTTETAQQLPQAEKQEPINFERAKELFQKRQRGVKLTADEEAYLERAIAERRKGNAPNAGGGPAPMAKESIGLKPLTELSADEKYKGEDGGLYGQGKNVPPEAHAQAAKQELARIQPLDADGKPAADGRVVFISISMSNATQEFSRFKQFADGDPEKAKKLTIVDCAQGGQAMAEWVPYDARPWSIAEQNLTRAMVTPQQVQVCWIKLANKGPRGDLQEHGRKLQQDTQAVIQNAKKRFPNLRIAYLSSRIYGGYAQSNLNPEPYAYESAFAARWLIQDQIKGEAALNFAANRGEVKAPLLLWGPYLWADGVTPRKEDQLSYSRDDLAGDGTHPSEKGRDKVGKLMLSFYKSDPFCKSWFVGGPQP